MNIFIVYLQPITALHAYVTWAALPTTIVTVLVGIDVAFST